MDNTILTPNSKQCKNLHKMTLSEAVISLTYKVHVIIGGIIGLGVSVLTDNIEDIIITALLAAVGSLVAGGVNYFFWLLKYRKKHNIDKLKEELKEDLQKEG